MKKSASQTLRNKNPQVRLYGGKSTSQTTLETNFTQVRLPKYHIFHKSDQFLSGKICSQTLRNNNPQVRLCRGKNARFRLHLRSKNSIIQTMPKNPHVRLKKITCQTAPKKPHKSDSSHTPSLTWLCVKAKVWSPPPSLEVAKVPFLLIQWHTLSWVFGHGGGVNIPKSSILPRLWAIFRPIIK